MEHNFQIMHLNVAVNKSSQYIMFCTKCGLSYEYTGYTWDMIPFKPSEQPGSCGALPHLSSGETTEYPDKEITGE